MSEYNNMDEAIAGLQADGNGFKRIASLPAYETILFGSPVFGYEGDEERVSGIRKDSGSIIFDADLITDNSVLMTINGVALAPVVFATDHDTTMALLKTAVEAAGYEGALTDVTNNRTLVVRNVYVNIVVLAVVSLGSTQAGATFAYESQQVFKGVALFIQKYIASTNTGQYEVYDAVSVMEYGILWVLSSIAVNAEDDAYVEDSGASINKFTSTNSEANVNCKFRSTNAAAGLVKVEVKGTKRINTEIDFS